ncbi:hypothetical protein [Pontibacillus sp. HMF3514]|uniref:hypothetical protein n=1 Tax=Pontibacillus sp. HMF3514 TaxID=2692425 RepID=UPI001F3DFB6E|nr:hypothetical protein [Pontibacillus sp. HMF3514]
MKTFHDIHKHLDNKEHWFQFPEKKHEKFEKEFNSWHEDWHKSFINGIGEIEKVMKELEKKIED